MRTVITSTALTATDADSIALSQTPLTAGNLTLTGAALVSGGVATLTTGDMARQVTVTTADDESGKTLTIYGTDARGVSISEAMTGPNATTGVTTRHFKTVTRVAVSAAFTDAVTVGTNGVASTKVHIPDHHQAPFAIGIGCVVSGTINYTLQHTFEDSHVNTWDPGNATWFPNSGLTAKTANTDGNYAFPVRGIRVLINSQTNPAIVTTTLIQGIMRR